MTFRSDDLPQIGRPVEGLYKIRLVRDGPWTAVRLWNGPPPDPDQPGQFLDRHWRWQATINGESVEVDRVWPFCFKNRVDQAEYDFLVRKVRHGQLWQPDLPEASPENKIDKLKAPPPF